MKKAIVLAAIFLISTHSIQAQALKEKDVPMVVKESCMKNFPGATDVKWMKEENEYECTFMKMGSLMNCKMSKMGKVLETGEETKQSALPASILSYLNLHHKNEALTSIFKVKSNKGKIMYEMEVKGKEMTFDEKGKLMKMDKY
jgi:hypothetical protein